MNTASESERQNESGTPKTRNIKPTQWPRSSLELADSLSPPAVSHWQALATESEPPPAAGRGRANSRAESAGTTAVMVRVRLGDSAAAAPLTPSRWPGRRSGLGVTVRTVTVTLTVRFGPVRPLRLSQSRPLPAVTARQGGHLEPCATMIS